ncbi:Lipoprotein signal peptidase (plasmid) [Tsukamurella tyrosinosolvens]|uniref:Lipoprotein signal peptidase n=1 Tax=Tsukamurella tyrosinosolvens TaxID=57704 RepID=A0A1H4XCG5_TSUTY|nr:signal peptidase II [Tsukamurella tyrosinosolvens]AUN41061.1 signal peptidase II [Tsukamurella tyrosinosolvens]KXO99817.1 lipoprotein signal peptidase [Tsukamurella tyrosinosolvens]KXP04394.1 lipoprotein signal peptidase [Tsukamurella tyrosinosolvens]KZL97633.1 lipoprotein signal peptidase [Tsukamurella tyrosinosolvens]MEC4615159.1 signal peptidase II [Tsukamurella tyrosinosolvens]
MDSPATARPSWYRNPRILLAVVAVAVFLIDLAAKTTVVRHMDYGEKIHVLGPFSLYFVKNPGAAFSMATGYTWVLTLIAVGVVVWIVRMGSKLTSLPWALGLGLVLGGALGNLADRIFRAPGVFRGHVIDFFSVGDWFPVFNTADSAISVAAVLLVALTLFGRDPYEGFGEKRTRTDQPRTTDDNARTTGSEATDA